MLLYFVLINTASDWHLKTPVQITIWPLREGFIVNKELLEETIWIKHGEFKIGKCCG